MIILMGILTHRYTYLPREEKIKFLKVCVRLRVGTNHAQFSVSACIMR